jgi:protein gp37
MGEETAISWCDHTFNLWIGCWKIDPECANCYAAATDNQRWGGEHWGRTAPRKWTGDSYWKQLAKWQRKAKADGVRRRVFCGSLMDWAETHPVAKVQEEMNRRRRRFWDLVAACPDLDFLMLTKRIEDAHRYLPWYEPTSSLVVGEPWPNVWIGTTAGTVKNLREHSRALSNIIAAVRFISCEPFLECISPEQWDVALAGGQIRWLIVGGESGHGRRSMHEEWVRIARDAAVRHGVAFHYKQLVEDNGKKIHLPILDGRPWS